MLVVTRKEGQILRIGDDIEIKVTNVAGQRIKLGITAPESMRIIRDEIKGRPNGKPDN